MGIADYSTTPASNTAINGINIAEGCAPANINDAIRQMMADLAVLRDDLISGSGAYAFIPIGTVMVWADDNPPSNFLKLNGAAISRVTHAALFAKWGTRYGTGDGSTTFNLPNVCGRALIGAGNGSGLTPRAVGATGGAETHQLSELEMPNHGHGFSGSTSTAGEHSHGVNARSGAAGGSEYEPEPFEESGTRSTGRTTSDGAHSHSFSGNTSGSGGNGAHNNMMPFFAMNLVVRAL